MFGKTGSLLLSISNLPPQTSRKALKAHVQRVVDSLDASGFRLSPAICSCSILRLTDHVTGVVTHQGLVSIQPPKLALQVIEALERAPLRGLQLKVSRYRHSSFSVRSSTPLTSMSDLLGMTASGPGGETAPLKLDIVADTGMRKPTLRKSAKNASGVFAH